ncbi:MAG TPA: alpha/beta hydrolase [Anaerolineaceae bacterium]|nr:alpha/beta hydrolase [Anaerolineaceae bacterium]
MSDLPESYFEQRIRSFYEEVDRTFRVSGCEPLGAQDIFFRLSRVATPFVEFSEIKRICADVDRPALEPDEPSGHRRWPFAWARAANRYRQIAERAEAEGHAVTAGRNYLRAALLAHSGQLFCRPQWPEKRALQRERADCYLKAARFLGLERLAIPYAAHQIPAYLWLPKGVERPPLVIMCPGANSVKEELHRWASAFVDRGMATLTFDGPGQGELSPYQGSRLPLRFECYHPVFTAIIDYAESALAARVDCSRTALWGQATGGHLVTRACEQEKRPVALVNLDGFPTLQSYPSLPPDVMEEQRDALGFSTFVETWRYLCEHGDAMPAAEHIDVPYLLIHGSRNDLAGNEAMDHLAKTIGPTATQMIFPDGNLGVFNWDFIMTDAMSDWLSDRLHPREPQA